MPNSVSILGAGRVGTSIARLLFTRGYEIKTLVCRTQEHAEAAARFVGSGSPSTDPMSVAEGQIVFLTVPDDRIAAVCEQLVIMGALGADKVVVHCSGVLGIDALQPAADHGATVVSIHPMQSVASPQSGVELLPGSYFGVEGTPTGILIGRELVSALKGVPLSVIDGGKSLYHAGAVFASNYLVVVLDIAVSLLQEAGVAKDDALKALTRLAAGSLQNVSRLGVPEALTGPIDRGDVGTVAKHLEALSRLSRQESSDYLSSVYCALGEHAVSMARQKHPNGPSGVDRVAEILSATSSHKR